MKIPQQFIDDFNTVMNYAECTKEEAAFEKKRVMKNFDDAARCYSVLAAGIRGMNNNVHDSE